MTTQRTLTDWLNEQHLDVAQLAESSRLDRKVIEAIAAERYTTSPEHRERIAAALGVSVDDIRWSSTVAVDHIYGHGPQFGRSP